MKFTDIIVDDVSYNFERSTLSFKKKFAMHCSIKLIFYTSPKIIFTAHVSAWKMLKIVA